MKQYNAQSTEIQMMMMMMRIIKKTLREKLMSDNEHINLDEY